MQVNSLRPSLFPIKFRASHQEVQAMKTGSKWHFVKETTPNDLMTLTEAPIPLDDKQQVLPSTSTETPTSYKMVGTYPDTGEGKDPEEIVGVEPKHIVIIA